MIRAGEFGAFLLAAAFLHAAVLLRIPNGGFESGGLAGDPAISIAAPSSQVSSLVEVWTRPPAGLQRVPETVVPRANAAAGAAPVLPSQSESSERTGPDPLRPAAESDPLRSPSTETARRASRTAMRPKVRPDSPPDRTASPQSSTASSPGPPNTDAARQSGRAGEAASPPVAAAGAATLQARWGGHIRAQIERNRVEPRIIRTSGIATVRLLVTRNGSVRGRNLHRSSGNPEFDRAALRSVDAAGQLPAAPAQLSGDLFEFEVPVRFDPGF